MWLSRAREYTESYENFDTKDEKIKIMYDNTVDCVVSNWWWNCVVAGSRSARLKATKQSNSKMPAHTMALERMKEWAHTRDRTIWCENRIDVNCEHTINDQGDGVELYRSLPIHMKKKNIEKTTHENKTHNHTSQNARKTATTTSKLETTTTTTTRGDCVKISAAYWNWCTRNTRSNRRRIRISPKTET